jgi:outer membrane receptor protein involved in Fe transport
MRGSIALLRIGIAMTAVCGQLAPASAQVQASYRLDIPAQDMESALKALASATHEQIVFRSAAMRGKRSNALRGSYTPDAAVAALIRGSGLSVSRSPRGVFIVVAAIAAAQDVEPDPEEAVPPEQDIVVTGTHIVGAPVASPVVQVTQRQMREAGQRDLGDVIRDLPSNYNGGQNPGARFQAGTTPNTNVSGSSALNLRGLGPDATLTLLNGRRLPYDGTAQAVDVSAIPLDAVAEIQVMPDGASALYGSDAVGGVANIILRRDFDGVATALRFGTATEGGGFLQEYNAVGGKRWSNGGALVALQYDRQNAVGSDQRDYTRYVVGPNTLLDAHEHFSGLATAHQDITASLSFNVDALYSWRYSNGAEYSTVDYAATTRFSNENYAVSPTLTLRLPGDWTASLGGSYGANDTYRFDDYIDKVTGENLGGDSIYENYAYGGELDLEGRLFAIPGGDVRLAFGGGYRFNHLRVHSAATSGTGGGRGNYYGYGEVSVPLVSSANAMPLLHQLSLSGALRHEEYDRFGGVTTPKLGLVYAPVPDLDLKFSWGRSFKAPTLRNEYQLFAVVLQPAFYYGGNYPADATVLFTSGGNRNLKPERARTFSTTLDLHPRPLPGLKLSLTYFDIDYTDRVVQPVSNAVINVLDNPAVQEFIDYDPTSAEQAAVIARDANGLGNYLGVPYDPAKVVAIVRNQLVNAARQRIRGVDLVGSYRIPVPAGDVTLSGQASWLRSNQRNTAGAPLITLAGTNFNPPRFRGRGGVTGHFGAFTPVLFVNYTGPITDLNVAPPLQRGDMATLDLSLMWKAPASHGPLKGFEIGLYVTNLTDARPPYLAPFDDTTINYDSTNYSPLGRFVSVSLRKAW